MGFLVQPFFEGQFVSSLQTKKRKGDKGSTLSQDDNQMWKKRQRNVSSF
jgi:hypothetical protein